jgi:hypothetical protein
MSALAYYQRRHLELAGLFNRQVILAEMYAVSAGGYGNVSPVVNDTDSAGVSANLDELDGKSEKLVVSYVLGPKLDTIGAAGGTFVCQRNDFARKIARNYDIQLDVFEFLRCIAEKNDVFFKLISIEPQLLDYRGDRFVFNPDNLGERPQSLGQTLAAGNKEIIEIAAGKLLFHRFACTDVAECISAGKEPAGIKPADRRREFVSQLLGSLGQ